jgi:hypothetical protein
MKTLTLEPSEVRVRGLKALKRDLGAAGMAQFIQQISAGRGNYSLDRHAFVDELTLDEIWMELKTRRPRR